MSVIVFVEIADSKVKKSSLEAISFAKKLNDGEVIVLAIGQAQELNKLGNQGADKVLHLAQDLIDPIQIGKILEKAIQETGAKTAVFAKSGFADPIAARLSVRIKAGLVTNISEVPSTNTANIKKAIYTGKAFANNKVSSEYKVLVIRKNATTLIEQNIDAMVTSFDPGIVSTSKIKIKETIKTSGQISLPEAEIVVSAGRGMKGPENWGMIEELATLLHAATGCSKPVSDIGWRPHHEHVGQTGVKVSPNLYIAIGISGAIQHLAGVNGSKVIVVINKDPEAPFFKAADYGIVGDLFDIVPKLIEAAKKM